MRGHEVWIRMSADSRRRLLARVLAGLAHPRVFRYLASKLLSEELDKDGTVLVWSSAESVCWHIIWVQRPRGYTDE
jgi:hypothetical protein